MLRKKMRLGLDIGEKQTKLVELKKDAERYRITAYGSMATPPGAVDGGLVTDPVKLGDALKRLLQESQINPATPLVSAVAGQQVYTRLISLPTMKLDELRKAALYQASGFLPLNIEDVTADIYPVREYADSTGEKTEVLFVATRKSQVDSLFEACNRAGLKLKWVEIEPMGLARVYYKQLTAPGADVRALVNIGASRSYIAFYECGLLVLLRSINFGCGVFYHQNEESQGREILAKVDVGSEEFSSPMADFVGELSRSLSYAQIQLKFETESLSLTGGGARIPGMAEFLSRSLQLPCYSARPGEHIHLPAGINEREKMELVHDFPVAIGLALRGWL